MSAQIDWGRWREAVRTPTHHADDAYGHDRDEARAARIHDGGGTCYRHHMVPDGRGGGVCQCGETVGPEEL